MFANPELPQELKHFCFDEWMPNQSQKMMVNLEYTVYAAALIALAYLVCWANVVN